MNIGARTLKTGLAVAISVYICIILNIEPPLFAATSAVVCMQQSLGKSIRNALEQVIVNIVSIIIGIILGLTIPILFLSMALATITVIVFCTRVFKAKKQIVLAVISAIFVLASPQDQFLEHALVRSLAILIGIVTANIINFTIAPPRYQKVLINKMIELNNYVVQGFTSAVNRYIHLNVPTQEELDKYNQEYVVLLKETEKIYNLYRDEYNLTSPFGGRGSGDNSTEEPLFAEEQLYKDYLNYNRGLWQRAQDIFFLAEERKIRRAEANEPAISCEFNHIFEMLLNVVFDATNFNQELQNKIKGERAAIYPEPRVWSKLNKIFGQWQDKNPPTPYYMQSLNEVSVITYNIRWFAKESTRLLES